MATFETSKYRELLPFLEKALSSSNQNIDKLVALGKILNFLFVQVTDLPNEILEHYSTMADMLLAGQLIDNAPGEADIKTTVRTNDGLESGISWYFHPGLTDVFIETKYEEEDEEEPFNLTMKLTIHPDKVELIQSEY